MNKILLINSSKGWMARYENNLKVISLFGTDTLPTAFTELASPMEVKRKIQSLNPDYIVEFA